MSTIANRLLSPVQLAAEWIAKQLNPHIPVNEGIAAALALHLRFKGKGQNQPAGGEAEGEAYIIGDTPAGVWSEFTPKNIAYLHNGGWREMAAIDNLTVLVGGSGSSTAWLYDAGLANWVNGGYQHVVHDLGTISSGTVTPDEANGAMQKCINGGAFELAPPANNTSIVLKITNNASAGAITTPGFTIVDGDAFTTTDGDAFLCELREIDGSSHLRVTALQ